MAGPRAAFLPSSQTHSFWGATASMLVDFRERLSGCVTRLDPKARPWMTAPQTLKLMAALGGEARFVGAPSATRFWASRLATSILPRRHYAGQRFSAPFRREIALVPTGIAHRTITAILDGKPFEIAPLAGISEPTGGTLSYFHAKLGRRRQAARLHYECALCLSAAARCSTMWVASRTRRKAASGSWAMPPRASERITAHPRLFPFSCLVRQGANRRGGVARRYPRKIRHRQTLRRTIAKEWCAFGSGNRRRCCAPWRHSGILAKVLSCETDIAGWTRWQRSTRNFFVPDACAARRYLHRQDRRGRSRQSLEALNDRALG